MIATLLGMAKDAESYALRNHQPNGEPTVYDRYNPINVPGRAELARKLAGNPGIDTNYAQGEADYPPPPMSPIEQAVECVAGNQQRIDELLADLTVRLRMVLDHNEKDRVNKGVEAMTGTSCPLDARLNVIQQTQCGTISRLIELMGRLAL